MGFLWICFDLEIVFLHAIVADAMLSFVCGAFEEVSIMVATVWAYFAKIDILFCDFFEQVWSNAD